MVDIIYKNSDKLQRRFSVNIEYRPQLCGLSEDARITNITEENLAFLHSRIDYIQLRQNVS